MENYINFGTNHKAPYGSKWNPVIINRSVQAAGADYIYADKPILPCFDKCCKCHSFWLYLPICLKFDDISMIYYSEDNGVTNLVVQDRIGNYMRADRLKCYEGGKQLIHMMAAYDPLHLTVLSDVLPTNYNACCDTLVGEVIGSPVVS